MNPNPEWRQRACKQCADGLPQVTDHGQKLHWSTSGWLACTAPSADQYIEQLEARIKELETKAAPPPAPPSETAKPWLFSVADIYPDKTPDELCPPGATWEFRTAHPGELFVCVDGVITECLGPSIHPRLVIIPPKLGPAQAGFEHLPAYREPKDGEWVLEKDLDESPIMGAQPFMWRKEQADTRFDGPRWILRKVEPAEPPAAPKDAAGVKVQTPMEATGWLSSGPPMQVDAQARRTAEVDQAAADGARALELLPSLVEALDDITTEPALLRAKVLRRVALTEEVLALVERAKARRSPETKGSN